MDGKPTYSQPTSHETLALMWLCCKTLFFTNKSLEIKPQMNYRDYSALYDFFLLAQKHLTCQVDGKN